MCFLGICALVSFLFHCTKETAAATGIGSSFGCSRLIPKYPCLLSWFTYLRITYLIDEVHVYVPSKDLPFPRPVTFRLVPPLGTGP